MMWSELVLSKDGSLSQTKLAASTFHLAIFVTVVFITFIKREFVFDMWGLYAASAIGHAGYDKTLASVKEIKTSNQNQITIKSDVKADVTVP